MHVPRPRRSDAQPGEHQVLAGVDAQHKELSELEAQIRYHEQLYRDGKPEISDAVFDDLVDRYAELADALGVTQQRPDQKPGDDHTEGFAQVEHVVPMLLALAVGYAVVLVRAIRRRRRSDRAGQADRTSTPTRR